MYIKISSGLFSMPEINSNTILNTAFGITAVSMAYILCDEVSRNSPVESKMRNCMSYLTPLAKTNLIASLIAVSGIGAYETVKALRG